MQATLAEFEDGIADALQVEVTQSRSSTHWSAGHLILV